MITKKETNAKALPASVPYEEGLYEDLRVPEIAAEYLNDALQEGNYSVVLLALKDIIQAHGNVSQLAEKTDISRQAIYSMLSSTGNPTLKNFSALLKNIGLKISVSAQS